jgi:hypothetical protein
MAGHRLRTAMSSMSAVMAMLLLHQRDVVVILANMAR